jgi:uncharacterized protein
MRARRPAAIKKREAIVIKTQEMQLVRIIMNKNSDVQTIILKEKSGSRFLPIGIGNSEVNAIKMQLAGIKPPRPLTHDLLKNTIYHLGYSISKIVVTKLKDSTFFAKIHVVSSENKRREIDARPSDSIALALRVNAPIYASDELLDQVANSNA